MASLFIHEKISSVLNYFPGREPVKECKTEKQDSKYYILLIITKAIHADGRKQENIDKRKNLKIY